MAGKVRRRELTVDRREAGQRLDLYLVNALEGVSRKQAKRLVDGRCVSVNGRMESMASRILAGGERVAVLLPDPRRDEPSPELTVLYQDHDCAAVAKPAGIPSGPTRDATRVHAARLAEELLGLPLTLLHRLDKDTSGVLLLAKTEAFANALLAAFRERRVEKVYLALARGRTAESFEAVSHLKEGEGGRMLVVRSGGMRADTGFRTLAAAGGYSLVEARPRTGRTHQIRVHLAQAGHPILGDSLYGGDASVRLGPAEEHVPRQMLHARTLRFGHPALGREVSVEAPLPEDFRRLAEALFGRRLPLKAAR
jgi:23S rRNA pseudouridine1911/1915/1917 synthase